MLFYITFGSFDCYYKLINLALINMNFLRKIRKKKIDGFIESNKSPRFENLNNLIINYVYFART